MTGKVKVTSSGYDPDGPMPHGPQATEPESVWAIVEQMGHVRLAGRATEEEKFGTKMMRLDIPKSDPTCKGCAGKGRIPLLEGDTHLSNCPCTTFMTKYIAGSSLYAVTIVSEEAARHVAARSSPEPVHAWELPKQLPSFVQPLPEDVDREEREEILNDENDD